MMGTSKYKYLFEETYHGFQLIKGQLTGTCISEAMAWKFSAKAPGTIFRAQDGLKQSKTFMAYVHDVSISQLALTFKLGLSENRTYIATGALYPEMHLGTQWEMMLFYPHSMIRNALNDLFN